MATVNLHEAFRRMVHHSIIENEFYENFRNDPFHEDYVPDRVDSFYYPSLMSAYSRVNSYAENRLGSSFFVISLADFLHRNESIIRKQAKKHGVDGRIIAAIIAAKCISQSKSYASRRQQLYFPGQDVDPGLLSRYSNSVDHIFLSRDREIDEVPYVRADAVNLIPMLARELKKLIGVYHYHSGGVDLGSSPDLVALLFDLGVFETKRTAKSSSILSPKVSKSPLANWVKFHVQSFTNFRTSSTVPSVDFADFVYNQTTKVLKYCGSIERKWRAHPNSASVKKGLYIIPAGSLIAGSLMPGNPPRRVTGIPLVAKYSEAPFNYSDAKGFSWLLKLGSSSLCIHPVTERNRKTSIGITDDDTKVLFNTFRSLTRSSELAIYVE